MLFPRPVFPPHPAGPDEVVLDIRAVQAVAFELLADFDAFCQSHRLRYYLCGGTLLGAVRHRGFIPWDDDVDVFMARPDYQRLLTLAQADGFGPNRAFACAQNGGFERPFSRVYDLKTRVQRPYYKPCSGAHVWIDILPVDGLPEDPEKLKRLFRARTLLNRFNFNAMWIVGATEPGGSVLKRLMLYPIARAVGAKRFSAMIEHLALKRPYEDSARVGCLTGGRYGVGESMSRSAFEVPAKVTFEGREFETMSCWKEYLTGIYGDYMTPPPPEKRQVHMDYVTMRRGDYDDLCRRHPELQNGN